MTDPNTLSSGLGGGGVFVRVDAGISQRAPCIIQVLAPDPFLPSAKSAAGPNAFSSMNMLMLLLTSVKTQIPRFSIMKITNIETQKTSIAENSPILSHHSLVASVNIVPNIAKTPIIIPRMKNQIPESNTPSKTGRTDEITGRSLFGYKMLNNIKNISVDTKPRTRRIHEESGSLSPCKNSPINAPSPSVT